MITTEKLMTALGADAPPWARALAVEAGLQIEGLRERVSMLEHGETDPLPRRPTLAPNGRLVGSERQSPPVEAVQAELESLKRDQSRMELHARTAIRQLGDIEHSLGTLLAGEPESMPGAPVEERVGRLVARLRRERVEALASITELKVTISELQATIAELKGTHDPYVEEVARG